MVDTRTKLYWSAVLLYGIVLTALLLYLRFPSENFRQFCEDRLERLLPGTSCSIGAAQLRWPLSLGLTGVVIRAETDDLVLFEDSRVGLAPVWSNPLRAVRLSSTAYGGSHSARLRWQGKEAGLVVEDLRLEDLQLDSIPWLQRRLGRKITGLLDLSGQATIGGEPLSLRTAEAEMTVDQGSLELLRPILELNSLALEPARLSFTVADGYAVISEGAVASPQVKMDFQGRVELRSPIAAGEVELEGKLTPLAQLFQEKRQLRVIVSRMQQRKGDPALPFTIGGTVGRPTFVFTR